MKIAVGLMEGRTAVHVETDGDFVDASGETVPPGHYDFTSSATLTPSDLKSSFTVNDVTIGIGFHWERKERQTFRGVLRIIERGGLTVINDVHLEDYVASVISSEMSASCPLELLKAHAVISRSWLWYPRTDRYSSGLGNACVLTENEIIRWYGREAHRDFDVCADDHCQRYQGITKAFSCSAANAVAATAGEMLFYEDNVCDARFYKCCGGLTENYSTAWEDRLVPYLTSVYDGPARPTALTTEEWIRENPPAYCNTSDADLVRQILPNFDQETRDFYRWQVRYDPDELGKIVASRVGKDLGTIQDVIPMARGASGRIYRLKIVGHLGSLVIGKELEIRRALSSSHLYSSAFVVDRDGDWFVLKGAGWGHGVGLCQIGAAVMASQGFNYRDILAHYYPGTMVRKW